MEPLFSTPEGRAKLYLGDAIEVMASFPDACVDAIVTDPPYGLEFMGKEWDRFKQTGEFKGGGHGEGTHPAYGAWDNKPSFYHRSPEEMQAYQSWTTAWATEAYRILKPGAYMLVMGGTRTHHRLGCGLEDAGLEIRDELCWIYASGFPKNYDVSKGISKKVRGYPQGGPDPLSPHHGQYKTQATEGKRSEADKGQQYGQGSQWTQSGEWEEDTCVPATPEAQYWEGYGTALKPAHEPIWLCKKPNEGTYVDNVLKHGCGAMNIDGSRIGYEQRTYSGVGSASDHIGQLKKVAGRDIEFTVSGRWPANVIVDCYPEEFIGGVVIEGETSISPKTRLANRQAHDGFEGKSFKIRARPQSLGTIGEAEIGNGLLGPYTRFFVIPKPSKAEKTCDGKIENKHVTVKPVRLGKWLIKLITPHQHPVVVADPFCGSGSFLVAGEELNIDEGYQIEIWGIDKDEDSVETARARIRIGNNPLLQGVVI